MATQEPNVYAGLAVVIGGLMHARPRFFAKVMGELLFWVGEDKMLFGSDYAHLGAEVADRGLRRLGLPRRRGVLGLPAARPTTARGRSSASTRPSCTASRFPRSCAARRPGRRRTRRTRSWSRPHDHPGSACWTRSPRSTTPSWTSRSPRCGFVTSLRGDADGRRRRRAAAADAAVRAELRVPDGGRRARARCAGCRGCGAVTVRAGGPLHRRRDQRRDRPRRGLHRRVPGRDRRRRSTRCASCSAQGAGRAPGAGVRGAAGAAGATPARSAALRVADLPDDPEATRLPRAARAARHRVRRRTRRRSCCRTASRWRPAELRAGCASARLVRHEPGGATAASAARCCALRHDLDVRRPRR